MHDPLPQDLSINTALVIPTEEETFRFGDPLCLPFLGIGAVLGYSRVVQFAVQEMGADQQAPIALKRENGEIKEFDMSRVGAVALRWCIMSKQPEAVKNLVENGVQFRWLPNEDLEDIFHLLFHINGGSHEYGPLWQPSDYEPRAFYGGMREMRRSRAKTCYKEKQKMLATVIDAGLPRDLFVPRIDTSIDKKAEEVAKAKGLEEPDRQIWKKVVSEMSRRERKARDFMGEACMEYNQVTKRAKQKTIEQFYYHVLAM